MGEDEAARRKADELLRRAIATKNVAERSRLINEAAHWHMKSLGVSDAENPAPDGTIIPFSDDPQNPEEPEAS